MASFSKRIINQTMALLVLGCLSIPTPSQAAVDDDSVLAFMPAILAGANKGANKIDGLAKVKKLHGRWKFHWAPDGYSFDDYYRFNSSSAQDTGDGNLFVVNGSSSLYSNFSGSEWCGGGMIGSYNKSLELYLILCNWGYDTNFDGGSAYFFNAVASNFGFTHLYYIPSSGELINSPTSGAANRLSNGYRLSRGLEPTSPSESRAARKASFRADFGRQSSSRVSGSLGDDNTRFVEKMVKQLNALK